MSQIEVRNTKIYKATTSFSHILGNLTMIIEDYIKDAMPPNYFKGSRATTEVSFKELTNIRKDLVQIEKPYLIIDPVFLSDESMALPRVNWDRFIATDHSKDPYFYNMNSEFFFKDEENNFSMGYTFNRYKMNFRIVIIVDSPMLKLSLINYLLSNFRFRHMFSIERYTETLIPKAYINYIADKYEMDINSNDFLQKLNQLSSYTILRLHRPATGTTEFFTLTSSTIQLTIPDMPSGQDSITGRLKRSAEVEFNIEVETNVMNNFLLATSDFIDSPNDMMTDYMVRIQIDSKVPVVDKVKDNLTLYTKISMEFENVEEEVDLFQFLGTDVRNQVKYIQDNGITDKYADIVAYRWKDPIDMDNTDLVEVDETNMKIKLKSLQKDVVYTVFIYLDMGYLSNITKFINEDSLNTTPDEYEKK